MTPNARALAAAAILALLDTPAFAGTAFFGDRITFDGFASIGAVRANTNEGEFRRDDQTSGADRSVAFDVDTNLGLQLTAKATDWLSATVQSLTMQRTDGKIDTEVEWAYLKLQPTAALSLFAGRMTLPMFLVSDSRNVGYANTWLRPPNEVYGMALLHRLEGGNVSYALPIKSSTLTATAIAGKSSLHLFGDVADVDDVKGGNLQWELDGLTLRAGRVQGHVVIADDIYVFSGIGATYDRHHLLLQGEFVTRRSQRGFGAEVDADGWYTLAGYRLKKFVPYASYARTQPKTDSSFHLSEKQSTIAAGLRWDAFSSAALKFQIERIDTYGTSGISFSTVSIGPAVSTPGPAPPGSGPPSVAPITKPVTVISLAMDVVF